jgi:chromosome segregation ATPase
MTKKLIIAGVALVACLWIAKKTQVMSYACTLIANGRESVRKQIPRDLELARIRNEIKNLDRDYTNLLGPIAEKKAAVARLEKEIAQDKAGITAQRTALLELTKAVEEKQTQIAYNGATYKLEAAKGKLARDFSIFKKKEQELAAKEKLLEAEQQNVAASLEQLDKLVSQKREFEIRLAQLEAEEAVLHASRVSTPLKSDDGRVADIKNSLDNVEHGQAVEKEKRALEQQYGSKIADAQPSAPPAVDTSEVRNHLQGTTNTGNNKVSQDGGTK